MPTNPTPVKTEVAWASNPNSPDQAIRYAQMQANSGNPIWYRRCLAFVGRCYGLPATGTNYAIDMWTRVPPAMRHTGTSGIPKGALLIYRTGQRAGHIALYDGNGHVYSNDIKGNGKIGYVTFNDLVGGIWNLNYVGWIPPYFPDSPLSKAVGSISVSDSQGVSNGSTSPGGPVAGPVAPAPTDPATERRNTALDTIAQALVWSSDAKHWYNILFIILGIILILIGIYRATKQDIGKVVSGVTKTTAAVSNIKKGV